MTIVLLFHSLFFWSVVSLGAVGRSIPDSQRLVEDAIRSGNIENAKSWAMIPEMNFACERVATRLLEKAISLNKAKRQLQADQAQELEDRIWSALPLQTFPPTRESTLQAFLRLKESLEGTFSVPEPGQTIIPIDRPYFTIDRIVDELSGSEGEIEVNYVEDHLSRATKVPPLKNNHELIQIAIQHERKFDEIMDQFRSTRDLFFKAQHHAFANPDSDCSEFDIAMPGDSCGGEDACGISQLDEHGKCIRVRRDGVPDGSTCGLYAHEIPDDYKAGMAGLRNSGNCFEGRCLPCNSRTEKYHPERVFGHYKSPFTLEDPCSPTIRCSCLHPGRRINGEYPDLTDCGNGRVCMEGKCTPPEAVFSKPPNITGLQAPTGCTKPRAELSKSPLRSFACERAN